MHSLPRLAINRSVRNWPRHANGALIAFEAGTATPYALENAESRGELFIGSGVESMPV